MASSVETLIECIVVNMPESVQNQMEILFKKLNGTYVLWLYLLNNKDDCNISQIYLRLF